MTPTHPRPIPALRESPHQQEKRRYFYIFHTIIFESINLEKIAVAAKVLRQLLALKKQKTAAENQQQFL
jgi:hypothetical protein